MDLWQKLDRPCTRQITKPTPADTLIEVGLVEQAGRFAGVAYRRERLTRAEAFSRNEALTVMKWEQVLE